MAELKSGVIGCAICIFALMGSIFGASLMTAENTDVPITTYNYITDVTGTFETTNAPEYIDYNPSANYVGYSISSVNYTKSLTPNAYRYIVSYPRDGIVDESVTNLDQFEPYGFGDSPVATQILMNVTANRTETIHGVSFGSTTTSEGYTYNVVANTYNDFGTLKPKVTNLINILEPLRSAANSSGIVSITTSVPSVTDMPIIITDGTYTLVNISDGINNPWHIYTKAFTNARISNWNTNTNEVQLYDGTQTFTVNANTADVYYTYKYNMGGTPVDAPVNITLSGESGFETGPTVTITKDSSYPTSIDGTLHNKVLLDNYTTSYNLPTTHTVVPGTTLNYNLQIENISINGGVTKLRNIINSFNLPQEGTLILDIQQSNIPIIFHYGAWTVISGQQYYHMEVRNVNIPDGLVYNIDTGTVTVGIGSDLYTGSLDDIDVIFRYSSEFGTPYSTSATIEPTINKHAYGDVTNTGTYPIDTSFQVTDSINKALITWNGTFNMGTGGTYLGTNYTITPYEQNSYYVPVTTLWYVLQDWDLTNYVTAELDLTYPENYPILFYGGTWAYTDHTIGTSTERVYTATLNENNSMPDRMIISESNHVKMYRNNVLMFEGSASDIKVIYKYAVNTGSNFTSVSTRVDFDGYASIDRESVAITVNNSSSYPSDAYTFRTDYFNIPGVTDYVYLYPLIKYNGTTYNNMGIDYDENTLSETVNICLTNGNTNNRTTYITKLSNIFSTLDLSRYDSLDLNISYGAHPIIFTKGDWEYTSRSGGVTGLPPYRNIFYYYYKEIDDSSFPDRVTYNKVTDMATFYKNGNVLWTSPASKVQVIYKYWIFNNNNEWIANALQAVTDQSVRFDGIAKLTPSYQYANPESGVTLKDFGSTTWKNNYQNDVINILWTEQNADETNDLNIIAGTSTVRITRDSTGEVTVFVTKQNGDTDLKNIGNWHKGQLTINVSAGTLTVTPIAGLGSLNFTDAPIEADATSYVWTDWYTGDKITQLTMNTSGKSLRFGVNGTSVFLNTYGVVMFDPSLDIETFFPELTEWRLNFFSFALVGDSVTINNVTYPVNKADNSITVTDIEGNSVTGVMNNVYLTKEIANGYDTAHYYLNFANSNKSADLGEVTTNTVSFGGMWYFTTGLYELGEGTAKEWTWLPQINLDFKVIALIYIAMVGVALIIGKGVLHADISGLDWVILICSSIIALIIAGGVI